MMRNNQGITIIEVLVSMLVISILVIGSIFGFQAMIYHYKQGEVLLEVDRYGTLVVKDIAEKLRRADGSVSVRIDEWNGHSRIYFAFWDTTDGLDRYNVYYQVERGKRFDYIDRQVSPGEKAFLSPPRFLDDLQRTRITIDEFRCSNLKQSVNYSRNLAESVFDIRLVFKIEIRNSGGDVQEVKIPFHRQVFVPDVYRCKRAMIL